MSHLFLLSSAFALLALPAWAQTTAINGTVEDQNHKPTGGVTLRIERQDLRGAFSVRSSSNGAFLYVGLPVGVFRVFCQEDPDSAVEVQTQVGDAAIVNLTCVLGGFRPPDRGSLDRRPGRGIVDRVRADLDRVARGGDSFSEDEMRRFNRVRDRIAEFQSAREAGRFDREVLNEVIVGLNAIIERTRLRARDQDCVAEDLRRLQELRDRPDTFTVKLDTSEGPVMVEIHRAWAPIGADHFYELVKAGYFEGARVFRVVPRFIVQFGIAADPAVTAEWKNNILRDDPVLQHNVRGTLVYATAGPNARTTQMFINLGDNTQSLDPQGSAPIGRVISGMEAVDALYPGYGETPDQRMIEARGNQYLQAQFPRLDYIKTATVQ
jgi:peptidyl-prolyl cis-trans isomerase A (cyclophilin A)